MLCLQCNFEIQDGQYCKTCLFEYCRKIKHLPLKCEVKECNGSSTIGKYCKYHLLKYREEQIVCQDCLKPSKYKYCNECRTKWKEQEHKNLQLSLPENLQNLQISTV